MCRFRSRCIHNGRDEVPVERCRNCTSKRLRLDCSCCCILPRTDKLVVVLDRSEQAGAGVERCLGSGNRCRHRIRKCCTHQRSIEYRSNNGLAPGEYKLGQCTTYLSHQQNADCQCQENGKIHHRDLIPPARDLTTNWVEIYREPPLSSTFICPVRVFHLIPPPPLVWNPKHEFVNIFDFLLLVWLVGSLL